MKSIAFILVFFVGALNAEVPAESAESSPSSGVQAGKKLQKKKSNLQGALTITLPVTVAPEYTVCHPKENVDFKFDARLDLTSLSLSAIAP